MSEEGTRRPARFLRKFELLLIAIISIVFVVWGISRCNKSNMELERLESMNQSGRSATDSIAASAPAEPGSAAVPDGLPAGGAGGDGSNNSGNVKTTVTGSAGNLPVLYVTINGLKLRKGPHLDSVVIARLSLYEEVFFLGEHTDFTDTINLGYVEVAEPWFRVRHQKGHEGWVYGAGVDFYKYKREGVIE